ncbi:MAG: hypothetical protein H7320_05605, partial [Ferruginibacter sp.]|nr:hypothetical protein [Ferruginibacter sp.]
MKTTLSFISVCFIAIFFYQCSTTSLKSSDKFFPVSKIAVKESEDEDGIKEAQEMEFKLTRDVALGYIPKDRLIKATNALLLSRKNNTSYRENTLGWVERGPYLDNVSGGNGRGYAGNPSVSGRLRAIWVDLSDATNKTVWVGSSSGGLWKTSDITASPANWVLANDYLTSLSIASICQDPRGSKSTMYFGTGEKTNSPVRGAGIWKSIDNGNNWALLPNTTNFSYISKIICDADGNIYVASVSNNGLLRSSDGGNSWTNITPAYGSSNVLEMNLSSTGTLHVIFGFGGNSGYRYTASPATVNSYSWTSPQTVFTNTPYNNTTLASSGNTLYATPPNNDNQTDQIWKSTDGGANWFTTGSTPPVSGPTPLSSGQGWYCQAIA